MRDDVLEIGPWIPGVVPRIALVALVAGASAALGLAIGWQTAAVATAALGAIWPRTGLAWFSLAVVPLGVLWQPLGLAPTMLAVAALHLGHVLAAMMLAIPARSRVSLAALRPTAMRWLGVQVVAQALAVVAVALPRADGPGLAWAAPVGAGAVAILAVLLLLGLDTPRHPEQTAPHEQSFE